ncbi:MAG: IPT/TIG domain-containing protein, partial [Acidobacteria bacterium]|nr:IPT/TIG domain-containing protein [Acidobacteriota bacterium]
MAKRRFLSCACLLSLFTVVCSFRARAQLTPPVITGISPSSVTAGGLTFTLTVNGSGFLSNSTVQVNGSNRPTVFKSALQLTATIFSSDIATPMTLSVTVFTVGIRGGTSNAVPLPVTTGPAPVLTSVSPEFVAQGAVNVRMTLQGANFRPGATVVISPPLAKVSASNGHTRATDVLLLSASVLNSGTMTAVFSMSPRAVLGLRAIDVLNLDGTSTAGSAGVIAFFPGSSQPLRVESSNSLGAPLSVLNMALLNPRDGTVVVQGAELNADAILAGAGTGVVIGQWLWDGNVVEQFSASIVGGQSTAIRTRQSLPTWFLGIHTLQLRMVQPNQIATKPILVVINPGSWQSQQLIWPEYGSAFSSEDPPRLLWAPVPGAMKYQVGFSDQPYLSTIRTWYGVVDNSWEVPPPVWRELRAGQLYWTVRVIETSGSPRKPLPMRSIYRAPADGLSALQPTPARTPAGSPLLEWKPVLPFAFYYVVVSSDEDGEHPVRQYLTTNPNVDLRALDRQLVPGTTYYWRVNALTPNGNLFISGQP